MGKKVYFQKNLSIYDIKKANASAMCFMLSCYVLNNIQGVPITSKSSTSLGLLQYRHSINRSNWIKHTHHMAKTAKHFDTCHSSKSFVGWNYSKCTNSVYYPIHKVSKIQDPDGEIIYLCPELAQNRIKLSNTTRKMILGSVFPWVRPR